MIVIRDAEPDDAAGIARVHVTSWRSAYAGLLPAAFLVGMSEPTVRARWSVAVRTRRDGHGTVVATDPAGTVLGFVGYGNQRTGIDGFAGEFYALYLHDDARGLGLGRRLMGAAAERMVAAGRASALVWCLSANPARWFYERVGGVRLAERPMRFAGTDTVEVCYGWPDLAPLARQSAGSEQG
ncbi:GNAT family N-acetyltransferase [Azospirillum halopraeferens]|uniref:GNAT family N-acetyltransferase n=1 Tax=Azospirillum halopraeferens TaxID=34010 RepID=UPI0003FFAD3D|nr:GNAT family N-acetyltransferase [Azospirillum halopraeferens]